MKHRAWVLILALALAPASATAQGKAKGKTKKGEPAGTTAATTTQGAGSCSPDKTPPVIHSISATPNVLWSPNHRMTPVSIRANVTDNCSAAPWSVTAVASDEPVNGTGEGDTEPDWAITGAHAVNLRAERAGSGDGRIYTITITARDAAGNSATATTMVSVPHSQKR